MSFGQFCEVKTNKLPDDVPIFKEEAQKQHNQENEVQQYEIPQDDLEQESVSNQILKSSQQNSLQIDLERVQQ